MAHFAKLNNSLIVEEVLVVDNSEIMNNGVESEIKGIEFLTNLTGYSNWKQTSYNMDKGVHLTGGSPFRLNYAQPGFKYDADLNGFIQAESPYPSWTLNTSTGYYHAPVPRPDPGSGYSWDEESQSWVQ